MAKQERVPAQPLLDYLDTAIAATTGWSTIDNRHALAANRIAKARRTKSEGGIPDMGLDGLDDICTLLGVHISLIYGDEYFDFEVKD